jgi:hypothetical protein
VSFTSVFGGTTVYSAEVSYRAVALTANVTLDWPTETAPTGNVLSDILDVTPSGAGFTIRLPEANMASVGQTALFFNVGADSFTVADNGGNTVMVVAAGQAWQVYLTDNTSVNGAWRSYQYGAGTSVATAGSLIGAGIKAIGTTLNQAMSSTSLNTNYTAGDSDRSEVFNWTGGAGTFSLPSAATVGNDWFVHLRNSGTGGLTIATTVGGQNINGSATLILNPGDSGILFSDGSNFFTIGLGKSAAFAFDFVSISLTGQPSPYILAGANLNRVAYRFTGNITGNVQIVVPSTVQQYWVTNGTDLASAPYTIEVKTLAGLGVTLSRDQRAILFCDGTDVLDADTAGISLPLSVSQGGTGATTDSGARINLGATAIGNSLFTATTAASARVTLGSSVVGDAVFVAADKAAARAAIDAVNIAGDTMTGALGVGASAATGSISDTTAVRGGVFRTVSGSVVALSGVAQGLLTVPNIGNNGTYIVSCGLSAADPTLYSAVSLALMDNNVLRLVPLATAAAMTITNTGNQINATQSSGGSSSIFYTLTRVS